MKKKIGVVILNYNDPVNTEKLCIELMNYKVISRIVIVDNSSTDDSEDILTKFLVNKKNISLIISPENKGYGHGNNIGINFLRNKVDYICVANPDIRISEKNISETLEYYIKLKEKVKVGVISPRVVNLNNKNSPVAWKIPTKLTLIINSFLIFRSKIKILEYNNKKIEKDKIVKVEVLPGSFLFFESTLLDNESFFDEKTFLYNEENILFYKLKEKKYSSFLLNDLEYNHFHGRTINKNISNVEKKFILSLESEMIFAKDYLKCSKLFLYVYHNLFKINLKAFLIAKKLIRGIK